MWSGRTCRVWAPKRLRNTRWVIFRQPDSASVPVLTIDGPSGAGKGTISRLVASRLGWHYLDSGALYRGVGVAAGWAGLDLADPGALIRCAFDAHIGFEESPTGELRVIVNGVDATDELRTETAGAAASAIAAKAWRTV